MTIFWLFFTSAHHRPVQVPPKVSLLRRRTHTDGVTKRFFVILVCSWINAHRKKNCDSEDLRLFFQAQLLVVAGVRRDSKAKNADFTRRRQFHVGRRWAEEFSLSLRRVHCIWLDVAMREYFTYIVCHRLTLWERYALSTANEHNSNMHFILVVSFGLFRIQRLRERVSSCIFGVNLLHSVFIFIYCAFYV